VSRVTEKGYTMNGVIEESAAVAAGVEAVAQMMAIAAITAPKTKGENFVQTKILQGDAVKQLSEGMVAFGEKVGKKGFDRDGGNVLSSEAVVLIGVTEAEHAGLDCGACGFPDCATFLAQESEDVEFKGPICAYRLLDMGIAIGSAVKTASMFNVDNRIMYRIGAAARDMGLVDWDFVMGVPLSVSGKSVFFDR
jgi:uncharacterized ferredoxin-like protein